MAHACAPEAFFVFEENNGEILFNEELLLAQLKDYTEVHIVTIFGGQGTGKSSLLNVFSGRSVFGEGHRGRHETRGIQGVVIPFPLGPSVVPRDTKRPERRETLPAGPFCVALLLLDSEGTGSGDTKDTKILALTSLASAQFLYNFTGTVDEHVKTFRRQFILLRRMRAGDAAGDAARARRPSLFGSNITFLQRDRPRYWEGAITEDITAALEQKDADEEHGPELAEEFREFMSSANLGVQPTLAGNEMKHFRLKGSGFPD